MNIRLVISAVLAFWGLLGSSGAESYQFTGIATDPDTNELLYTEVHQLTLDAQGKPLTEQVTFFDDSGVLIGDKLMRYQSASAPSYESNFYLLDRYERVTVNDNQLSITSTEDLKIEIPTGDYAIDGGFHFLIQSNLDRLQAGQAVEFKFLSPGRGQFLNMKAESSILMNDQMSIELTLRHWLLGALLKPIQLKYDLKTGQLLHYRGLTNIANAEGTFVQVQIHYTYPEQASTNETDLALAP